MMKFGATARKVLAAAIVAAAASQPALAAMDVKFALDWKFEGPSAPFFVALDKGYYKAEGLNVTIDSGNGSVQGIGRVAAGTYPLGFADINSLVKFRDQNPDKGVKGIFMVYNAPPFAIITLAKTGIKSPKDLEGRILGAPAPDGAYAQWKAFVKATGIDASKVKIENVGFPVREPMLAAGKVDAITGYSFSSFLNLRARGVAAKDIKVMLMTDYGLDLYGNTLIVHPAFAAKYPKAVKGFVKATLKGWKDTVSDPAAAIKYVMKVNKIANEKVELARLKMALRDNVLTAYVKANGMGDVDMARLKHSISQIADTYKFKTKVTPADVFTDAYLPPKSERMLP